MSCDLWRWTEKCESRLCIGDCDYCSFESEDEEYTIYSESGTVSVGGEQ